jgi:RHS repeat-associated protein
MTTEIVSGFTATTYQYIVEGLLPCLWGCRYGPLHLRHAGALTKKRKMGPEETTVYIGGIYEKNIQTGDVYKYYYAGRLMIGVRKIVPGASDAMFYTTQDNIGSAALITNSAGAMQHRIRYTPFGEIMKKDGTGEPVTDKLFAGYKRIGAKTGLYYAGARFYSAELARFLSPDPLLPGYEQNPQLLNPYNYVANNPLRYTDPTGMRLDEGWTQQTKLPPVAGPPVKITPSRPPVLGPPASAAPPPAPASQPPQHTIVQVPASQEAPLADASLWLDKQAAQIQTASAHFSNLATGVGCAGGYAAGGGDWVIPGCMLGKGVGEFFTTPFDQASNLFSIAGTTAGCMNSQDINCGVSIALTTAGTVWFLSEDNLNAFFANAQSDCVDHGFSCNFFDTATKTVWPW